MLLTAVLSPAAASRAGAALTRNVWRHRELLTELTKRELLEPHAGQAFGVFWLIAHPLLQTAVYIVVFAVVFKARMPVGDEFARDYAAYVLAGIIPWLSIQQGLARGAVAITQNAKLVKQVVFPIEILPVKAVLTTLPAVLVGVIALLSYLLATGQGVPAMSLLLPLVVAVHLLGMIGLAMVVSAACVFIRDVREFVPLFSIVGLFLLPIAYPLQSAPPFLAAILYANPFTYTILVFQDILYSGTIAQPLWWVLFFAFNGLAFIAGCRIFRWAKNILASAL